MKNLIFIFSFISLFIASTINVHAQKRAYDINIDANQDPDSTYIMLSNTSPIKYRYGKGMWKNYVNWLATLPGGVDQAYVDTTFVHAAGNYTEDIGGNKTFLSEVTVPTSTYDSATWEGNLTVPTKGALHDIYQALRPAYKEYTAFFDQSGTSAPTVTIVKNTVGNIVWTYDTVGQYLGTLTGAFPANKFIPGNGFIQPEDLGSDMWQTIRVSDNQIELKTYSDIGLTYANNRFADPTAITIKVYY